MKNNRKQKSKLKVGFIMDPIDQLLYWEDTSISIMEEAQKRGALLYYLLPEDIFYHQDRVLANGRKVNASLAAGIKVISKMRVDLSQLDVIINRKEPPFDLSYFHLTYLLDLVDKNVFIMNSPSAVRKANEKLYVLNFKEWAPPTVVTKQASVIEAFQKQLRTDVILKPLHQKGGIGISLLKYNSENITEILNKVTAQGTCWMVAQKFLKKNLMHGDKRILLLNGESIGQFQRIPKPGEFRSNISLGGRIAKASLTQREKEMILEIGPKLARDGLYFAGLDVVDEQLIEINVTSPAGIPELIQLEGSHPEVAVVDFLEHITEVKQRATNSECLFPVG
jgi:glutathione synthase